MKFLCDENLYNPIIEYLKNAGHETLNIKESEYAGLSDDIIYKLACDKDYVIITMDKDFTRILRFPSTLCGGIIVVKIYRKLISETLKLFKNYFDQIKEENIKQNLVIINPDGVRIKRLRNRS